MNQLSNEPTTSNHAEGAEIMARMAAGESAAMEQLYALYSRPVFSFALRMMGNREIAEEVLQEVYLRAWRQAGRFSTQRGSVLSWLLSITHNLAIDELRKQQRRPRKFETEDSTSTLDALEDEAKPVEETAIHATVADDVRRALNELPPLQRQVLELGYFNGLSQREIAEHLNEPLGTIKTRMRLAIRKLQNSTDMRALDQV